MLHIVARCEECSSITECVISLCETDHPDHSHLICIDCAARLVNQGRARVQEVAVGVEMVPQAMQGPFSMN